MQWPSGQGSENMKKILLFAVLLPTFLFAQIGPILTEEKPLEFISDSYLYRTKATDEYTLQITSNNQFENTAVQLSLGHGAMEAMSSLTSLFAVYASPDLQFTLQHYTFQVGRNRIVALHSGVLENTAGDYILSRRDLAKAMYDLMVSKQMPMGDITITYYGPTAVFVCYHTYGFENIVGLNNVQVPYSRQYVRGDIIAAEDVALLKMVAENPNAYRGGEKRGALVYDKEELMRACAIILEGAPSE